MTSDLELMRLFEQCGHRIDHRKCMHQSQSKVLSILNKEGPMTQKELLEKMCIKSGSLSEVVQKVENGGYIIKTKNADDRRNYDLVLTKKGKQQAEWYENQRDFIANYLFKNLSEEEKEQLTDILERLLDDWSKLKSCAECEKGEL